MILGCFGFVLDLMFVYVLEKGVFGLCGCLSFELIEVVMGCLMIMVIIFLMVIYVKDFVLIEFFLFGDCMLIGFVGECWNCFFGGEFD